MTKFNRLSSTIETALKSKLEPQLHTLTSLNTPKHNNHQQTRSFGVSQLTHNLNSTNTTTSPFDSIISIVSSTTTSSSVSLDAARHWSKNVTDGNLYAAPSLKTDNNENAFGVSWSVPWNSSPPSKIVAQQRKETSRLRKGKHITNRSGGNIFGWIINKCAQNLGACVAVDLFGNYEDHTSVKDYNAFIKVCLEKARKSDDEDFVVEQISAVYKLLQLMKEKGFPLDEGTYGPLLLYFIDTSMEEEFHFFLDVIKDKNDAALPRLGYYEMSLFIRVNNEEKIQELCHYVSTNDSDETIKLLENYLLALCDGDRKSDLLQLLEVADVTKVSSANNLAIFKSLGRLSLESYAEKFLLAFKDLDYGADEISKLIFNYVTSVPNSAVEDHVSKFKNLHLLLEIEPHLKSYEEMVVYCCKAQEIHVALDVVHQMCEEGLTISEGTLNFLLRSIEDNYEFHLVRRIYSLAHDKNLKLTDGAFKMLISFYVKIKEFDRAYAMLDDLKNFNLVPTASMYNVIMAGYFREKNPCAAIKVFNQMKLAGVQPDSQTYFYLISNCSCEKKIKEYKKEMEHAQIGMTKYAFMALVSAYASCRQFGRAKEVICDSRIPSSELSEIKSVLVYALASHGQLPDALSIYEEMKETGLNVMPKAILSLIEYCQSKLDLIGLLKLLEEVRDSEYWTSCCSRVLLYCLHNKHLSAVIDLLKQLKDKFQHNEFAKELLFDETFAKLAEMESPDLRFAMGLLQVLEKEIGVSPSRKCLDFLLAASIKAKDVHHSRLVWKKYEEMSLPYNVMSYLGMYQALLAGGEHQSANAMLSKIPTGDPHVRTIIQACQRTYLESSTPQKGKERKKKKKKVSKIKIGTTNRI